VAKEKPARKIEVKSSSLGNFIYYARDTPKETTFGHSFFGTIDARGLNLLQANKVPVYSAKEYCDALAQALTLLMRQHNKNAPAFPREFLGSRGPSWKTSREREGNEIYIDGVRFYPEIKQRYEEAERLKELAKQQKAVKVETPKVVAQPQTIEVEMPQAVPSAPTQVVTAKPQAVNTPVTAVADSTKDPDAEAVRKILTARDTKNFTDKQIQEALVAKYGKQRGAELWNKAIASLTPTTPTVPEIPVPPQIDL